MKALTQLDFVKLAVSKDPARYNLGSVYRDTESLVATDGHRLHYTNGQEKIAKGFYLDGLEAQFPDYKQILPTAKYLHAIVLNTHAHKELKPALTIAKLIDKRESSALFTVKGNKLIISVGTINDIYQLTVNLNCGSDADFTFNMNLSYFVDALLCSTTSEVILKFWNQASVLEFEGNLGKAYVMPLRMPK